jgi:hypothetical protein
MAKFQCLIWIKLITCRLSGICHCAVDVFSLLGCNVAHIDSWLLTFWDNILLPSPGVKQPTNKYKKTLWYLHCWDWTPHILQISNISILTEGQHQLVCMHDADERILSSLKKFFFARNWQYTSTRNLLPFHDTWMDFARSTNTPWATQKFPSNFVINNVGTTWMVMKTEGNEKM